jgi:hypothetical protein
MLAKAKSAKTIVGMRDLVVWYTQIQHYLTINFLFFRREYLVHCEDEDDVH